MRSPKNSTQKVVPETCVCVVVVLSPPPPFLFAVVLWSRSSFSSTLLSLLVVVRRVFHATPPLFFSRAFAGPFCPMNDGLPKQDVSRRPHSHNRKRVHVGDLRQNSRLELVVGAVQIESLRLFLGLRSRTRGLVRLERVEVLRRIGNEEGFGERRRRGQTTARGKGRGRDDKDGNGSTRLKNKEQIYI